MNKTIIIAIGVLILVGAGGFFLLNQNTQTQTETQEKMMEDKASGESNMMDKKQTNKKEAMMQQEKGMSYSGTVLAGKTSPYLEFNKADYDKAMEDGKLIFLEFYANWCPICRAQAPKLAEGFDALNDDQVIGFRVNYNDDATDETEKQLAKDFGVTYQHTHVILKNGKVVSKSNDDLDKDSFVSLIQKAKQ